ncbi:MAG: hypothetical protein E7468_06195 [Ruminococcaceae bacterium]|nr:hypothetical protein [Oscillospiraceae bacterium]
MVVITLRLEVATMKFLKNHFAGIGMFLLEILVGVLLLINPVGFTSGIIMGAGLVLLLVGIVCIIKYFRAEPQEAAKSQNLMKGLIALLAGSFCALRSEWFVVTFPVITLIYGVVILITGLGKIQWTVDILRQKKPRWFLCALSALVSTACGLVIIAAPFTTTAVLWMFTGIGLIVDACFDIVALIFTNRKAIPDEPTTEADDETAE